MKHNKLKQIQAFESTVHFNRTTRRYIPEDRTIHNHCCENLSKLNQADVVYNSCL
jgi:hypothetical protein